MATIPRLMRALPARTRSSRIPPPGKPSAKVENSRCKVSRLQLRKFAAAREDPKRGTGNPTFVLLQFDDSPAQPDRHGMCAVVRPQLREDIRHVPFDRVLGEIELRCDLLVRVARGDQPEDPNLALRQLVFAGMFSQTRSQLGGNPLLPRMYRSDGRQQFFIDASLEQISARAGF